MRDYGAGEQDLVIEEGQKSIVCRLTVKFSVTVTVWTVLL